jgi:hypothetical protein
MRMQYKFMSLLLLVLCFLSAAQAFESVDYRNEIDMPPVEQVIATNQGVGLLIGESWLIAEALQATGEGLFVFLNEEWMPLAEAVEIGDYQASWECSRCHRYSMDGVNVCPYCGKHRNG